MSDAYTYRVTPAAARDIAEIADYIAVELCARESAVKIIDAMEAAIQRACRFPHAAAFVNDPPLRRKGYRKLIVENYIILYLCDDADRIVNVMRVVYYARDYMKDI